MTDATRANDALCDAVIGRYGSPWTVVGKRSESVALRDLRKWGMEPALGI